MKTLLLASLLFVGEPSERHYQLTVRILEPIKEEAVVPIEFKTVESCEAAGNNHIVKVTKMGMIGDYVCKPILYV